MTAHSLRFRTPKTAIDPLPAGNLPWVDLTLVIPAYNEAARLPATLRSVQRQLAVSSLTYRVLVVDDGSHDETAGIAAQIGPEFTTLRLAENQGKGAAVRAGMLASLHCSVVAFTDADLPFDLVSLLNAADWIQSGRCDVVVGDRTHSLEFAAAGAAPTALRRISGFAFHRLVDWLVNPNVRDTQCGLKVFSADAASQIFSRVQATGFAFDVEVICWARRLGLTVETVPVRLINSAGSTVSVWRHTLPMCRELLDIRRRLRQAPVPVLEKVLRPIESALPVLPAEAPAAISELRAA